MGNNTIIQLRNDTAANWASDNPTLAAGEMGLETDTQKMKFGDGSTAWNSLPYIINSFKYGLYTLSAPQSSNVSSGNHVEFNTSAGSLGGLSTGTGQDNGKVTLAANKTYKISGSVSLDGGTGGANYLQLYNRTASAVLSDQGARAAAVGANYGCTNQCVFFAIFTPSVSTEIELRFYSIYDSNYVYMDSWLLIEEYAGY